MDTILHYELPYFGQINLKELQEDYRTKIRLDSKDIRLDINFENKSIELENVMIIDKFLQNIPKFDIQNLKIIKKDLKEEGETAEYIEIYLEDLDEDVLATIIDVNTKKNSKVKQLMDKLKLIRVGLYPDGEQEGGCFGVFDYSIDIDGEPCEQLLVIKTNEQGELDHITLES